MFDDLPKKFEINKNDKFLSVKNSKENQLVRIKKRVLSVLANEGMKVNRTISGDSIKIDLL